ncbi:MAG: L,D-transpeptidase [Actinomycetota bacterium]|nr:L,D-transpeptidase [Actinomycetota bacterium]MDQ6946938.1 L,D-transpeptidase [Actinomycetota bacterium]
MAVALLTSSCARSVLVSEGSAPITTVPPPTTTTTATTIPACPVAAVPAGAVTTQLATPNAANLAFSATPGGPAVGHLKARWGGPSTRPVLDQQSGWVEVRLDSRPNGSTGWVPAASVALSTTPYRIVISVCQRSLTLFQGADQVYSAPVGVGRPQWPTPVGASFVNAIVNTPARQQYIYGPTVVILGSHSNVFTEFDGGDGTVAIHGYPSDPASTRGVASSHGCIRVGPDTINAIKAVPVGTPIDVIA